MTAWLLLQIGENYKRKIKLRKQLDDERIWATFKGCMREVNPSTIFKHFENYAQKLTSSLQEFAMQFLE